MITLGFDFLSIAGGLRLRHYGVLQKPEVRLTCPRGPQGKDGVDGEVCVFGVCINKEKSKGTGLLKGTMNSLFSNAWRPRHIAVMVHHRLLPDPIQCGH